MGLGLEGGELGLGLEGIEVRVGGLEGSGLGLEGLEWMNLGLGLELELGLEWMGLRSELGWTLFFTYSIV